MAYGCRNHLTPSKTESLASRVMPRLEVQVQWLAPCVATVLCARVAHVRWFTKHEQRHILANRQSARHITPQSGPVLALSHPAPGS